MSKNIIKRMKMTKKFFDKVLMKATTIDYSDFYGVLIKIDNSIDGDYEIEYADDDKE